MDINNLIKQAHATVIEKGFYDCDKCGGSGTYHNFASGYCKKCNGTGKKDRDISELIALVIRELYEALEAHRSGKFANKKEIPVIYYNGKLNFIKFESSIKGTLEDELADVLIRLFDMMGYLGIEYDEGEAEFISLDYEETFFEEILKLNKMLINLDDDLTDSWYFTDFIVYFIYFCKQLNIDIETHVKLKMEYNKTREYKHGKRY